jgi:hypothetical protein
MATRTYLPSAALCSASAIQTSPRSAFVRPSPPALRVTRRKAVTISHLPDFARKPPAMIEVPRLAMPIGDDIRLNVGRMLQRKCEFTTRQIRPR